MENFQIKNDQNGHRTLPLGYIQYGKADGEFRCPFGTRSLRTASHFARFCLQTNRDHPRRPHTHTQHIPMFPYTHAHPSQPSHHMHSHYHAHTTHTRTHHHKKMREFAGIETQHKRGVQFGCTGTEMGTETQHQSHIVLFNPTAFSGARKFHLEMAEQ
jgi:hypothetical protein